MDKTIPDPITPGAKKYFQQHLLRWNTEQNRRSMPWKGEKDPYKIWLSEIILQQTRVEQGLAYYNRFVQQYPTIQQLAAAPEQAVFKLWEGLGYYSRCKNLLATARYISAEFKGVFPNTYEGIVALKGVGPYTAAAIASFAFGLPYAVVDGNVYRVLARFFCIDTPIDSTTGKKYFGSLAQELLAKASPAAYNQALMDFGATVCKPAQPLCTNCPLRRNCTALVTGTVTNLPVKEKSIVKKNRWFYYLVIEYKGHCYVRQRPAKDIWENLYEFVLTETDGAQDPLELLLQPAVQQWIGKSDYTVQAISANYRQQLTHQTILGQFIRIHITKKPKLPGYEAVPVANLALLAFPKFITSYLTEKKLTLSL